ALQHRLHARHGQLKGGRLAPVAVMGVLSAVIVSPCVSAPLAGALLEISRSGDMVLGGSALFAMALGMGVPLMLVGILEGALLPRAGAWMVAVKKFFGLMLLAVAIWILSPVLPPLAGMLAWSLLAFGVASLLRRSWVAAALPLIVGAAILVGALAGSRDPLRPLAAFTAGGLDARRLARRPAGAAQGAGQAGDARLLRRLVRLVQGDGVVHLLRSEGARAA